MEVVALEIRTTWSAYVPRLIANNIVGEPFRSPLNREQRLECAVLIADIAGFTPMSEAFGEFGRHGTEQLVRLINRYFEAMIAIVLRNGGDIAKFGGDSLIILCPWDEGPIAAVRRATSIAHEMRSSMREFESISTDVGTFPLTAKIGIGAGPLLCTVVGDPSLRLEYIVAGGALDEAATAQERASPGEIVLHKSLADQVEGLQKGVERDGFVSIPHIDAYELPRRPHVENPETTSAADRILASFLHPVIARRVRAGQSDLVNEHRRLTTLFVGLPEIDYDSDREAVAKLQRYFGEVLRTLETYGGHLAQVEMGDKGGKYIVLFGSPVAHENDVERALTCSLALAAAQKQSVRIGVTTGLVFCGHVGSHMRREYAVFGDAVNLAARLMQTATRGEILVDGPTREAAPEGFVWTGARAVTVKGKRDAVSVASLSPISSSRTPRAQQRPHSSPFVGRTEELEYAFEQLDQAASNHGLALGISGEPGIGKSRLAREISRAALEREWKTLEGTCQSHDQSTSFLVWRPIWRSIFGLNEDGSRSTNVEALEETLRTIDENLVLRVPLLNSVLGTAIPDNELTASMDFESRRDSLKQLLLATLQHYVAEAPVVLLLEDCHWIDFLSHDLLTFIGRNIAYMPVLLIFTYRLTAELAMPPSDLQVAHHFNELQIGELDTTDATNLVIEKLKPIIEHDELLAELGRRITTMAEGNPFYIEELANYFLSEGVAGKAADLDSIEVPESLRSLIVTRIDQLAEAEKTTLKVASVIGRSFPAAWVWGSFPEVGTPSRVKQYLRKLDRLDLTLMEHPEPQLRYMFKHAITQEVTYESLSIDVRRSLHESVAHYIEQSHADDLSQHINSLAYHYGHTDNNEKKRVYFRMAAEAARLAFATEEAIDFYGRLASLVPAAERVEILTSTAELVELIGNWEQADTLYRQARRLASEAGDSLREAEATCRLGHLISFTEGPTIALPLLRDALATFDRLGNQAGACRTLRYLSQIHIDMGERDQAAKYAQRQMELANELGDVIEVAGAYENMGLANWDSSPDLALVFFDKELTVAESAGDVQGIIHACNNLAGLNLEQGQRGAAISFLQRSLEAATKIGYQLSAAALLGNAGIIYRDSGDYDRAFMCLGTSLRLSLDMGDRPGTCNNLGELAVLRTVEGRLREADMLFKRAIELSETLDIPLYTADFLYHRAQLEREQGLFRAASKSAHDAFAASQRVEDPRLSRRAEILCTLLEIESGELDGVEGSRRLEDFLDDSPGKEDSAWVHYERWRLTGSEESRTAAGPVFRELFEKSGNVSYRSFFEEMTGESLPDPDPLPPLTEEVTRTPVDFDRLMEQADELLRAAIQERAA